MKPNIDRENGELMWFENEQGEKKYLTEDDVRNLAAPPADQYPIAVTRSGLEVTVRYYKRRDDDGGFGGGEMLASFTSSANEELVRALILKGVPVRKSLLIAARACERCMNILANELDLSWGYPENSEEAKKCHTSCDLCK